MSQTSPPPLNIPPGSALQVRIIDSTSRISGLKISFFMEPPMPGFKHHGTLPSFSFLIEHASGQKVLFDLGVRKDWKEYAPVIAKRIEDNGWEVKVEKNVSETLEEHGVQPVQIDSIIWSHWHWDHLGDPSTFPPSTELVVGPGFKKAFLPGWPSKEDSPVRESDFAGRKLREITFGSSNSILIGKFKAFDYFGDGSFYLLASPGHAIGHLAGLARTTTNPDTFIFMGGDVCHHGGEIRPSEYRHLPQQIDLYPLQHNLQRGAFVNPCPAAVFEELNVKRGRGPHAAFFQASTGFDAKENQRTIGKVQEADADNNIWFIMAHDDNIIPAVDLFPQSANEWKAKGWAERVRWAFLKDFQRAVEKN